MTQTLVIGVDEAGRGPWAGPVTAAAVVLGPKACPLQLAPVRDSKALTAKRREALVPVIKAQALAWGVGWSEVDEIDGLGILMSTFVAMQRAVHALFLSASCTQGESARSLNVYAQALTGPKVQLIVDGSLHPARYLGEREWPWPTEIMVKADATQLEVAAASILAKTARDTRMVALAKDYPGYGFELHAGYGTKQHQEALRRLGPVAIHRKSFRPIRELLLNSVDAS
ncbi:MAG: ribonuclease HII [Burkholderiaceae bacterium]